MNSAYLICIHILVALICTLVAVPTYLLLEAKNKDIPKAKIKAWVRQRLNTDEGLALIVFSLVASLLWWLTLSILFVCLLYKATIAAWINLIDYFYPVEPSKSAEKNMYR